MHALVITDYGGPEVLAVQDRPRPVPADDEVLVQVAAVGLNPVDLQTRAGIGAEHHRVRPPMVAGWDVSGVVRAVGAQVHDLRPGDQVVAMSAQPATGVGTAAQFVSLKRDIVGRAPTALPLPHAAALPLAGLTAEQALGKAGPASGRTLLVIGAAGAVGGMVVQLARRDGWRVLGVGRPGESTTWARSAPRQPQRRSGRGCRRGPGHRGRAGGDLRGPRRRHLRDDHAAVGS